MNVEMGIGNLALRAWTGAMKSCRRTTKSVFLFLESNVDSMTSF
jgi:hypothetical protein